MNAQPLPDPRRILARPDLAAASLRDTIAAVRYADPQAMRVGDAVVPMRKRPDSAEALDTELLFGEAVDALDIRDGWAFVQGVRDRQVGYVPATALAPAGPPATHRVAEIRTFLYPSPSIKTVPILALSYGSEVAVEGGSGEFAATAGGFVVARHLVPVAHRVADPVAEAGRFLGVPYLWGGKSSLGLDCSALVQLVHHAAGHRLPRDSDLQEAEAGEWAPLPTDPGGFRRGDLLFWPGHVAIAEGQGMMIHANAHHMLVAREPIGPALARIAARGHVLRSVRRLVSPA